MPKSPEERLRERYERYAGKWLAETVCYEPPIYLEPTDENLAAALSKPTLIRPARREEFDDIRAAIARLSQVPEVQAMIAEAAAFDEVDDWSDAGDLDIALEP